MFQEIESIMPWFTYEPTVLWHLNMFHVTDVSTDDTETDSSNSDGREYLEPPVEQSDEQLDPHDTDDDDGIYFLLLIKVHNYLNSTVKYVGNGFTVNYQWNGSTINQQFS